MLENDISHNEYIRFDSVLLMNSIEIIWPCTLGIR